MPIGSGTTLPNAWICPASVTDSAWCLGRELHRFSRDRLLAPRAQPGSVNMQFVVVQELAVVNLVRKGFLGRRSRPAPLAVVLVGNAVQRRGGHRAADVKPNVAGVCGQVILQQARGQCPRSAPELAYRVRRVEGRMRDQFVDGRVLVKVLPVLPRTEAVIETLRLFGREATILWLANAQARILAASALVGCPLMLRCRG